MISFNPHNNYIMVFIRPSFKDKTEFQNIYLTWITQERLMK